MKASFALSVAALTAGALAEQRNFTTIQASGSFDPAAATAVQTVYPKQHHYVKGRTVDHIWHIVLGAADFDDAYNNEDIAHLRQYGVTLTNYYALTHPNQANYLGMMAGDTFGLTEERFVALPSNVSTIVDSLEERRVIWAQYMEDQPFTAYPGWTYGQTYSRAANPLIAFDSVAGTPRRMANLRSLATFEDDYASGHMPQWLMIRPNLDNDGTNTDLATSAKWARDFLDRFIMDKKTYHRHAFVLTFIAAKTEDANNRVLTLVLGDVKKDQRGTEDSFYYDHYSILATTQGNYDLPSLGRYDCRANVLPVIGEKAHAGNNQDKTNLGENYNAAPIAGYLSSYDNPMPFPNTNCPGVAKVGVLKSVKKLWKKMSYSYYQWTFNY